MLEAAMEEALTDAVNAGSYSNQPTWEIVASVMKGPLATALAEAEARGRRQGLEEAGSAVSALLSAVRVWLEALPYDRRVSTEEKHLQYEYSRVATDIRKALATAPAETGHAAGSKIVTGLRQAVAHAAGDGTAARARTFTVQPKTGQADAQTQEGGE